MQQRPQLAFDLQHPDQVMLTRRASRLHRDGIFAVLWRRLRARRNPLLRRRPALTSHLATAPIVVAAIDLEPGHEALRHALTLAVRRVLATEPNARLACVNILKKIARLALDEMADAQGRNPHLSRLIELKHWARAIPITPDRITYHVLESTDPAGQLVDYARHNLPIDQHHPWCSRKLRASPLSRQCFGARRCRSALHRYCGAHARGMTQAPVQSNTRARRAPDASSHSSRF